jgi:solute:Na+ symporter, SSS family
LKLSVLDLIIISMPLVMIVVVTLYVRRFVSDVSQFLVGGRLAGRYLISIATGESGFGLLSAIAWFEVFGAAGLSNNLWASLFAPLAIMLPLLGYIVYRYRETRALTLAQFFEIRYSRRFRLFSGVMILVSGLINYAIYPAISAQFFVYYTGVPDLISVGGLHVPTYWFVMAALVGTSAWITLHGGQTAVMVSDCISGIFGQFVYVTITIALFVLVPWSMVGEVLTAGAPGHSLVDPFDNGQIADFSYLYVVASFVISIYTYRAWQGSQGYNGAARNAHEAKMGAILGHWRNFGMSLMYGMLAVAGLVILKHGSFEVIAQSVAGELGQLTDQLHNQMKVPVALREILPNGLRGLFCALMLFVYFTTDTTMLHSWACIGIQDVVMPLRKQERLDPAQHLRLLRAAVIGVALTGLVVGGLIRVSDYVFMFQTITMAIYLAGAGAVIIGGLYWSRGTTAGAYAAVILGACFSGGGIVLQQLWPWIRSQAPVWLDPSSQLAQWIAAGGDRFPVNGQMISLIAMGLALSAYIVVSLITCRSPHNMDRLLHRGRYRVEDIETQPEAPRGWSAQRLIGIDEHYTKYDKWIAHSVFWWPFFWGGVSLALLVAIALGISFSRDMWFAYGSIVYFLIPAILTPVTTVWFTLGGCRDLCRLRRDLIAYKPDHSDDGSVSESPAANGK